MVNGLSRQDVRNIEQQTGSTIVVALPPEYHEEDVGRFTLPMPTVKFKVRGVNRWLKYRGGMVQ